MNYDWYVRFNFLKADQLDNLSLDKKISLSLDFSDVNRIKSKLAKTTLKRNKLNLVWSQRHAIGSVPKHGKRKFYLTTSS